MAEQELACQTRGRTQQVQDRAEDVIALLDSTQNSIHVSLSCPIKQDRCKANRHRCLSDGGNKLFLHVVCSCFVIAHLAATFSYLAFKALLYARHLKEVITTAPWLLVLLACECTYFMGNVLSAIADHLPPPNLRPDLTFNVENGEVKIINTSKVCYPNVTFSLEDGEPTPECFPRVDILLTCCKEPTDIPQDTIKAALALDYPQDRMKVLVLDDGGDDDLKAFCQALQVEMGSKRLLYLRREKIPGVPHHFKCGNLNYGLKHSDAEYVVLVDADMVLHTAYLRKVLPHIVEDEDVSFVQVPQYFYNLAVGDPLNDASVFNYERVLVHRDSMGAAACIGTGAIFRRAHLDLVGGFQPHSITEDTVTSFALFNLGFRSVYLTEKLQMGLTPWSLEAYIKQRQRWGTGAFQQFSSTYKMMLGPSSKLNLPLKVPNSIQSRNRDESQFWWTTPYYFKMVLKAIFNYKSTFSFTTTSSIDQRKKMEEHPIITHLKKLKHVRVHLVFFLAATAVATIRIHRSVKEFSNMKSFVPLLGMSLFLTSIWAHMAVPIMYVVWPTAHRPAQRKSLLKYTADGTPLFNPTVATPKFHWPVIFHELLSLSTLVFWSATLYITSS
ncbi:hypothetical protein GOP47_0002559 [Adiantum capillus-veneris]|uniref:Glycosyltransferase 2-like domain-containing protein n=1 Tax=Adiantum capillus-veneris TaxID=13818 RepID=A0A9D4VAB1_ADICA|nr:hypothetical protein GOP47_0002559 [Adiantum capillus-veneris]